MSSALVPGEAREAELIRMMRTYGGMLVGLATGLLGDPHLAQDVVQETFLRAYRRMDTLRGERPESERAWLCRITVNLCRDQQRSRWFRFVDRRVTPEALECAQAEETDQTLLWAVEQLPMKLKEAILLHYYQDMRAEEMSETLGISTSAVYRRLERARQKLQELLEGWDFDE